MKMRKDFSIVNKDKVIYIVIISLIALTALANWIATSFGTFDDDMSSIFWRAMDSKWWKGWASFTVNDGYVEIMGYCFPMGIILFESVVLGIKKAKPNWWIAQHADWYKYVIILLAILFEVLVIYFYWNYNYKNNGFGTGYNTEFIIGKEYLIPEFVVSVVITNIIFWTLTYWLHYKVAKRPDFLELKIWRPVISIFLFMAFSYCVVMTTKFGVNRPYWYSVHFLDGYDHSAISGGASNTTVGGYHVKGTLERFGECYGWGDNTPYAYYMKHGDNGWNSNRQGGEVLLQAWPEKYRNWKWYQESKGLDIGAGGAFPSGHMLAASAIALSPDWIFRFKSTSKKYNMLKKATYVLGIIYVLDMIFALQISASHWWSDSTFSLGLVPVFYLMGYELDYWVMYGLNKLFRTKAF